VRLDPGYRVFPEPVAGRAAQTLDVVADAETNWRTFDALEPGAGDAVRAYVTASGEAYLLAAAVLLAVPWPGWLAALLPLPYAANAAAFWSVRDEDCERANRGWRRFLWLNLVTGFLVTMLLIAVART
jgi:phytoene dehydrogenase-like protein